MNWNEFIDNQVKELEEYEREVICCIADNEEKLKKIHNKIEGLRFDLVYTRQVIKSTKSLKN